MQTPQKGKLHRRSKYDAGSVRSRTSSYLAIPNEILEVDEYELSYRLYHGSQEMRMKTLEDITLFVRRSAGRFPYKDPLTVFHGFGAVLAVSTDCKVRYKALQLVREIIPFFGKHLDECMSVILLKLITNMGDKENDCIRRTVVQILHQYLKHSFDKERLLCTISSLGLGNSDPYIKREILLSAPFLFTKEFANENFYNIVLSIGQILRDTSEEQNLQQVSRLALKTIKELVGIGCFQKYLEKLPTKLLQNYQQASSDHDGHKEDHKAEDQGKKSVNHSYQLTDLLPTHVMDKISQKDNWRMTVRGIEEMRSIIQALPKKKCENDLKSCLIPIIDLLKTLLDGSNFQIICASLEVLTLLIEKIAHDLLSHLQQIVLSFGTVVEDHRVIICQVVMKLVMKIMYCCRCQPVVEALVENLDCTKPKTWQETMNFVTAGLLTYPEDEFETDYICTFIAPALEAVESQVRQAAMECLSVLASKKGNEFHDSLRECLENTKSGISFSVLMMAITTRMESGKYATLSSSGLVEYASALPSVFSYGRYDGRHDCSADIDWIVAPSEDFLANIASPKLGHYQALNAIPEDGEDKEPEESQKEGPEKMLREEVKLEEEMDHQEEEQEEVEEQEEADGQKEEEREHIQRKKNIVCHKKPQQSAKSGTDGDGSLIVENSSENTKSEEQTTAPLRALEKPVSFLVNWTAPMQDDHEAAEQFKQKKLPKPPKLSSSTLQKSKNAQAKPETPEPVTCESEPTDAPEDTEETNWSAPAQDDHEAAAEPEEKKLPEPPKHSSGIPKKSTAAKARTKPEIPEPVSCEPETADAPEETEETNSTQKILRPFWNTTAALEEIQENMGNSDWERKMEGLTMIQRLAENHPDVCCGQQLHKLVTVIIDQVPNLRSKLSQHAITILGDLFLICTAEMEKEVEISMNSLLEKSAESRSFVRVAVETAMSNICSSVSAHLIIPVLMASGVGHRNPNARALAAKSLEQMVEVNGLRSLLTGPQSIAHQFVPAVTRLASDGSKDPRTPARAILKKMMAESNFDELLERNLDPKAVREIRYLIPKMGILPKKKPPSFSRNSVAAAPVEKKRNPPVKKPDPPENPPASKPAQQKIQPVKEADQPKILTVKKPEPSRKTDVPVADQVRQIIDDLNSKDWEISVAALDSLQSLCMSSPGVVGAAMMRIFDKFAPCLHDIRGKVNARALEVMLAIVVPLKKHLKLVINMVITNVTPNLNSKSGEFSDMADKIMRKLLDEMDPALLIKPFGSEALLSNVRSKHLMVGYMGSLVVLLYSSKPKLLYIHVLPVLWQVLSLPGPSVTLKKSMASLVNNLYAFMGKDLVERTSKSQGGSERRLRTLQNILRDLGF